MGALSYANSIALFKTAVNACEHTERFGHTTTPNYDGLHDAIIAANLGEYQDAIARHARAHRNLLASMLSPEAVQDMLRGPLNEIMAAINAPEAGRASCATAFMRWREYSLGLSPDDTFDSRGFTFGAASAVGSPTGNGSILRLTVDEDDYPLEWATSETKTLEVIQDQLQVDKHHEVFELRGAKGEPDLLNLVGSGISTQLRAVTVRDSTEYIINPSFTQFSGTAPSAGSPSSPSTTTSITGWTLDSVTSVTVTLDTFYRDLVGETKTYAVKFAANRTITQTFQDRRTRFSRTLPYMVQVAVYRESNADGTLTITFGATTAAIDVSTLTNGAWNKCRLSIAKGLYHKNFKTNTPTLAFAWSSRSTGSIYLDDVIVAPWTPIDGTYWMAIGGATPWMRGDSYTCADTENASRGVLSYWGYRAGLGRQLRDGVFPFPTNNAGGETIADPT